MTTSAPHDEVGPRIPHAPASTDSPSRIAALASIGVSRDTVLTAAIAVGVVIVVKFAIALVQLVGNAIDFDPAAYASGFLHSPIGLFLGSLVLYPFPFYVAAFVALAALFPIDRSSTLTTVLARTLVTGAMGTVVLALVGFGTGIAPATRAHSGTLLALDVVFIPLSTGLLLTALLLVGSTVSWLWIGSQEPADPPSTELLAPADLPPAAPESPAPSGVVVGTRPSGALGPGVLDSVPPGAVPGATGESDVPGSAGSGGGRAVGRGSAVPGSAGPGDGRAAGRGAAVLGPATPGDGRAAGRGSAVPGSAVSDAGHEPAGVGDVPTADTEPQLLGVEPGTDPRPLSEPPASPPGTPPPPPDWSRFQPPPAPPSGS